LLRFGGVVGLFGGGRRGAGAAGTVVPLSTAEARRQDADRTSPSESGLPDGPPAEAIDASSLPADDRPAEALLAERDRLLADLASHLAERSRMVATLTAERDRLAAALADDAGAAARPADAERIARLEAALADAREEHVRDAETHTADRRLIEELRAENATVRGEVERLRAEAVAAAATIERVAARHRELEDERDRLVARASALEEELATQVRRPEPVPDPPAAADPTPGGAEVVPPPEPLARTRAVLVIDAADGEAVGDGAVLFDPRAPHVPALPAAIAVNLAAAGAFTALVGLRDAGIVAPTVGYAGLPGSRAVLPLGAMAVLAPPIDAGRIVAALADRGARGTRILTVGDDNGLLALRPALAQFGMSVSMAFDVKQADELLDVVRPNVVVLGLAAIRSDACGLVVRLAALSPGVFTVLVAGSVAADGFHAALADPGVASRLVQRSRLLADLTVRAAA
jgi:hypothetical protein